jgi:hypothetical protein
MPVKPKMIIILTPTLGKIDMQWCQTLSNIAYPMNIQRGFIPARDLKGGQIGQLRNKLVDICMKLEVEHDIEIDSVLWLDDDVLMNKLGMLTLLAHDADIAAGVYFSKGNPSFPLIFPGAAAGTTKFQPGKVFESWGYAQGLSVVKFSVYKRIIEAGLVEKDEYGSWSFFKQPDLSINEKGVMTAGGTEDFHFFRLAEQIGIKPIVDCTKHAFGFHHDLRTNIGYPEEQWRQYEKQQPIVWKTPEGEVVWD